MGCRCKRVSVVSQPNCLDNCLKISTLRVGCDDGPEPCGDTMEIDLTEYNNVTASPCAVVYSLKGYDQTAFSEVTLTSEGLLTFTSTTTFVKNTEFKITYRVDSPCSILSDQADVFICMKDLCKNTDCPGYCDKCTGDCDPEISLNDSPSEITLS